jgi:hypothetical protein
MEINNSKKIHIPAIYIAVIFSAVFISASFLLLGTASQKYGPQTSGLTKAITSVSVSKKNSQANLNEIQNLGQINQQ